MLIRFDGWDLAFDKSRDECYWLYYNKKKGHHLREVGTLKEHDCRVSDLEYAFVDGDIVQHKGILYVAEVTAEGEILIGTCCYRMGRAEDIKLLLNNTRVIQR